MSKRAAIDETSSPKMSVLDGGLLHEVFEVLELSGNVARVRAPFLFEVGEQLDVRIEHAGATSEIRAIVRAHVGADELRITELELIDGTDR